MLYCVILCYIVLYCVTNPMLYCSGVRPGLQRDQWTLQQAGPVQVSPHFQLSADNGASGGGEEVWSVSWQVGSRARHLAATTSHQSSTSVVRLPSPAAQLFYSHRPLGPQGWREVPSWMVSRLVDLATVQL